MPTTYAEMQELLKTARNKLSKPLERNTRLNARQGALAVTFHATDVVTLYPDGSFVLNSGGYHTMTTKERIASYLPSGFGIYQQQGVWYIIQYKYGRYTDDAPRYAFTDGMTILPDGTVKGSDPLPDTKALNKLNKDIRTYATRYAAAFGEKLVRQPRASQKTPSKEALRQAMADGVYLPELLRDAMLAFPGHFSKVFQWAVDAQWGAPSESINRERDLARYIGGQDWMDSIAGRQMKDLLVKYIKRQFGLSY